MSTARMELRDGVHMVVHSDLNGWHRPATADEIALWNDGRRQAQEPCVVHDWRDEKEFVSCKRCDTTMAKRDMPPPPGPFTHYAEGYKAGATGFIGEADELDGTARQMAREYVRRLAQPTLPVQK